MSKHNTALFSLGALILFIGGCGGSLGCEPTLPKEQMAYHQGVTIDTHGNSFTTGFFFGIARLGGTVLKSYGGADIFFLKRNKTGVVAFAKRLGGVFRDFGFAIKVDTKGSIYLAGLRNFDSRLRLLYGLVNQKVAMGHIRLFLSKLDNQGNTLWILKERGESSSYVQHIALTHDGLYATGVCKGKLSIGGHTLDCQKPENRFIAKINPRGQALWLRRVSDCCSIGINAIATDPHGSLLLAGSFQKRLKFGNTSIKSKGKNDAFLGKVSPKGKFLWVKSFGGAGVDSASGLTIDQSGDILFVGSFAKQAKFGTMSIKSKGKSDVFLGKVSAKGKFLWAKAFGGVGADTALNVGVDAKQNVYLVGEYKNRAAFAGHTLQPTPKAKGGIFVAQLNKSYAVKWIKSFGTERAGCVAASFGKDGSSYLIGQYEGNKMRFGKKQLTSLYKRSNQSRYGLFTLKIDRQGALVWAK